MPIPGLGAALGGGLVEGGLGLLGGWLQRNAARDAAKEQRRAGTAAADRLTGVAGESAGRITEAGNAAATNLETAGANARAGIGEAGRLGGEQLSGAIARFNPYSQAGGDALATLTAGTAPGAGAFTGNINGYTNDAGFKYRLNQFAETAQNSAAGRGLVGGNTVKAIEDYRQSQGSLEAGAAFERSLRTHQANRDGLNDLVRVGERANNSILGGTNDMVDLGTDTARTIGGIGMSTATGAGDYRTGGVRAAEGVRMGAESQGADLRTGAAAAGAAGTIGAANAWSDALTGVARGVDFAELMRRRAPATRPGLGVEPVSTRTPLPRTIN